MKPKHPKLAADIELASQVRDRLKTRAEEWPEYLEKFKVWENPDKGIDLSFGANKQGIWEIFSKPVVDNRKIRLTKRTITDEFGNNRQVFQFDMAGPNGADFRAITGDIDFLAILNPNGTMLLNPIKRMRIYQKLQKAVGMQHGESFTFAGKQALRAAWLRCCARGVVNAGKKAEKMITAQPNGKARVSEFVENKSITIDSPNSSKRFDKSGDFILISGAEYALKAKRGLVNRLIFRDLSDSITDLIGVGARVVYSLNILRRIIPGLDDANEPTQFNRDTDTTIVIPDGKGGLFAWIPGIGFELVPLALLQGNTGGLQQRSSGSLERTVTDTNDVQLFGSDGRLKLLPQSSSINNVIAGSSKIDIASREEMGTTDDSPWFEKGDLVVINPGGDNQEVRKVSALGSLIFTEPLEFTHQAGELVSVTLDQDNDGVSNIKDIFPNDPSEATDTDNDGIGDNADAFPNDPLETTDTDRDGKGNNSDADDDNDGALDVDELRVGSNPLSNLDTPEDHTPVKPEVLSLIADTVMPLSLFNTEISDFSDPDETGQASGIEVMIEGKLDDGSIGTIFHRTLNSGDLKSMQFPDALLDTGSDYKMSVSHMDKTGQASKFSEPFAFTTSDTDPLDVNGNLIEDAAETSGDVDINNNNVPDSDEGITTVLNAESGDLIGLSSDAGKLSHITVMRKSDLPEALMGEVENDMPLGLLGFRISGLVPGSEAIIAVQGLIGITSDYSWYQYDPNTGLIDITALTRLEGNTMFITYVDGGAGDLDGVANGRVVDPSGPVFALQPIDTEENNYGPRRNVFGCTFGDGSANVDPTLLLLVLLSLLGIYRKRIVKILN